MISFQPLYQRLGNELHRIESSIIDLWQKSTILEFRNPPDSLFFLVRPRFYWKSLPVQYCAEQASLLSRYKHWFELLSKCHARHNSDIQDKLATFNNYVVSAIELRTEWATTATFAGNRACLTDNLVFLYELLESPTSDDVNFVLIPDTNALLRSADPADYKELVDGARFVFIIVPTVLSELDGLKRSRANHPLGEKAEKAIRFIKGFRGQGSVLDGVTVAKTITVKMVATEPRMKDLPSWLDPEHQDDRLIGSVLEIQFSQLSAVVVLVTNDINLQNKAEMAFLPWSEPPT